MKRQTSIAVIIGALMALLAAHFMEAQQAENSQQRRAPSLGDTESWIKSTFTGENAGRSDCQEYDPG
jgi:hypothetical protein